MIETKNEFTIDSAKEYLNFLYNELFRIKYDRKIYDDFNTALIEQKAKNNSFIFWCLRNYHKVLVARIFALLEPKKTWKERQTIRSFIEYLSNNFDKLKYWSENQHVEVTNITNGKKKTYSIKDSMLEKLSKINLSDDLEKIKEFTEKLKKYRHNKVGHLTTIEVNDNDIPSIEELHKIIDELDKLMINYYYLFRISISTSVPWVPYNNFTLNLK